MSTEQQRVVRPENMARINTPELADAFIEQQVKEIRATVGDGKVLLALSGGVDSSVVAALLIKAIGDRVTCVHVNHGLLRKGEPEQVVEVFRNNLKANLVYIDASERFLKKLARVADSERKRKIIGDEFIEVFAEEARKLDDTKFLAQGTIYPDILESDKDIKAHHNAGGLPKDLKFTLIEPLILLYKDEVRMVGKQLGLPEKMVNRQPFPGPGLGVRCTGAITKDRLEALREADAVVREEIDAAGLGDSIWQYFAIVPDVTSTGVQNDSPFIGWPVVIRAVNSVDAVTATVPRIDYDVLDKIIARILGNIEGINRVLLDLSPKPTATIEWE